MHTGSTFKLIGKALCVLMTDKIWNGVNLIKWHSYPYFIGHTGGRIIELCF